MEVNFSELDLNKINDLLETKEKNIYVSDLINTLMTTESKFFNQNNEDLIKKELINRISEDDEDLILLNNQIDLKELNIDKYITNSYFSNISLSNINYKDYHIRYDTYKPYELFISDEIKINADYSEIISLGYFNKEYRYLALYKNDTPWMLITPNEINTMNDSINLVKGNIITFGLGLGYFQYMASLKKDVNKVYVVEKDKTIINLFKTYILPQFKYKEKIEIIEDDAFKFMKTKVNNYSFDYLFIDLYHNPNDGLDTFLFFKEYETKLVKSRFLYWLNESLISLVRRILLTFIEEQYEGLSEKDYRINKTSVDRLLTKLYKKFLNTSISSYSEVIEFISKDNILKLLRDL